MQAIKSTFSAFQNNIHEVIFWIVIFERSVWDIVPALSSQSNYISICP